MAWSDLMVAAVRTPSDSAAALSPSTVLKGVVICASPSFFRKNFPVVERFDGAEKHVCVCHETCPRILNDRQIGL